MAIMTDATMFAAALDAVCSGLNDDDRLFVVADIALHRAEQLQCAEVRGHLLECVRARKFPLEMRYSRKHSSVSSSSSTKQMYVRRWSDEASALRHILEEFVFCPFGKREAMNAEEVTKTRRGMLLGTDDDSEWKSFVLGGIYLSIRSTGAPTKCLFEHECICNSQLGKLGTSYFNSDPDGKCGAPNARSLLKQCDIVRDRHPEVEWSCVASKYFKVSHFRPCMKHAVQLQTLRVHSLILGDTKAPALAHNSRVIYGLAPPFKERKPNGSFSLIRSYQVTPGKYTCISYNENMSEDYLFALLMDAAVNFRTLFPRIEMKIEALKPFEWAHFVDVAAKASQRGCAGFSSPLDRLDGMFKELMKHWLQDESPFKKGSNGLLYGVIENGSNGLYCGISTNPNNPNTVCYCIFYYVMLKLSEHYDYVYPGAMRGKYAGQGKTKRNMERLIPNSLQGDFVTDVLRANLFPRNNKDQRKVVNSVQCILPYIKGLNEPPASRKLKRPAKPVAKRPAKRVRFSPTAELFGTIDSLDITLLSDDEIRSAQDDLCTSDWLDKVLSDISK